MKTLYLVRHAKSSWDNVNMADFDRPLNGRGRKNAPFMGKLMQEKNVRPDLVISSPANRAITTAEAFSEALGYPPEKIDKRMEIYEGGINEMLRLVRGIPETRDTVMLFGHNPTLTVFAGLVSGHPLENIVTCGVVRIDMTGDSWQETMTNSGTFAWYEYPKKYQ